MSGTGKSSVIRELVARGYKAIDTDDGWTKALPDGRQLWREDAMYGKAPEELRRFLDDVQTVEPLLRRVASHEVRTTVPVNEVVTTVLRLVDDE
jgi:dephospho-CoA kinase